MKLLVAAIGAVLIVDCCQRCSVLNLTSGPSNDSFGRKGASAKGRREVSFWRRAETTQCSSSQQRWDGGKRHKKAKDGE